MVQPAFWRDIWDNPESGQLSPCPGLVLLGAALPHAAAGKSLSELVLLLLISWTGACHVPKGSHVSAGWHKCTEGTPCTVPSAQEGQPGISSLYKVRSPFLPSAGLCLRSRNACLTRCLQLLWEAALGRVPKGSLRPAFVSPAAPEPYRNLTHLLDWHPREHPGE